MATTSIDVKVIALADWIKRGEKLFGPVMAKWKFVCPNCGEIQTAADMIKEAGLSDAMASSEIAFSCIGRHVKGRGCDWTLAGVVDIHKLEVVMPESGYQRPVFEFYQEETGL